MITSAEFIHPEDAAALQQMENIPGFPTLVKKSCLWATNNYNME